MNTRVLIVEDHPMFAEAVHSVLERAIRGVEIHHADSLEQAKGLLNENSDFDLALLDLWLPDTQGFEGLIELRHSYPKMPIVVLSAFASSGVVDKALVCGASGFISKATARDDLVSAVSSALQGHVVVPTDLSSGGAAAEKGQLRQLTKRVQSLSRAQLRVLEMLCQGLLNKQIAHELAVGETTVKAHVSEVLRKLNVSSRTQAVLEVSKLDFGALLALRWSAGEAGLAGERTV
ncbi:MAG: response regulator transcription factor [Hyphomicrobiaceae bacterium]|nr:response regulator transcription factor [Hyphomicrobiaceae bacterium]